MYLVSYGHSMPGVTSEKTVRDVINVIFTRRDDGDIGIVIKTGIP